MGLPWFLRDRLRAVGVVGTVALVDIVKRLARLRFQVAWCPPTAAEEFTAIGDELKVACGAP